VQVEVAGSFPTVSDRGFAEFNSSLRACTPMGFTALSEADGEAIKLIGKESITTSAVELTNRSLKRAPSWL
jgi:hypothetical protein